jgi:CheY-like chemotaxis protein
VWVDNNPLGLNGTACDGPMGREGSMAMTRVLVIDDEQYVRAAMVVALKANGFDVVAFESGRLGLSALDNSAFDLAIVDIYMPDMDGVRLIKALRERSPNLPIIAISGVMFRTSGRNVLNILANAHELSGITCLQKPFRPKELVEAIQNAIGVAACT